MSPPTHEHSESLLAAREHGSPYDFYDEEAFAAPEAEPLEIDESSDPFTGEGVELFSEDADSWSEPELEGLEEAEDRLRFRFPYSREFSETSVLQPSVDGEMELDAETDEAVLAPETRGWELDESEETEHVMGGQIEGESLGAEGFPFPAIVRPEMEVESELDFQTSQGRPTHRAALQHALDTLRPKALVIWADGTRSRGFGAPWVTKKYNTEYWVRGKDAAKWSSGESRNWWQLRLRPGKSPYDALIDLPKSSPRWTYECASYIQAAHLYALARSRGRAKVEAFYRSTMLKLRYHWSPGVRTKYYFRRERKTDPWRRRLGPGRWKTSRLDDATLLKRTAVGSRVMWHNIRGRGAWKNENTVKVAAGRYRAFPLFSYRRATAEQVSLGLASYGYARENSGVDRDALEARVYSDPTHSSLAGLRTYRDANVFLREVGILGPAF